jgi:UDP-glucose 4-epimerase
MKRVLVVGSGGRIGQWVVKDLKKHNYQIITVSSQPSSGLGKGDKHVQVDWSDFNLRLEEEIDVVLHFAHQTSAYIARKQVEKDVTTNLISTIRLVESLRNLKSAPHFIYAGSLTEYGSGNNKILIPSQASKPETFYDVSKIAVEKYLEQYFREGFFSNLTILRIGNLYGFLENFAKPNRGFLDMAIRFAFNGEVVECYGDGNYLRDFIHINDVGSAIEKFVALNPNKESEIYNLASGIGIFIGEALNVIGRELEAVGRQGIKIVFKDFPNWTYQLEKRNHVADISKTKKRITWEPIVSLSDGVSTSIKYLLDKAVT